MDAMARLVWSHLVIALMGVVTALVGAGSHRAWGWIGLALCLAMMTSATVFARAWRGFLGLAVMGTAWTAMTVTLAMEGPGGSLLIAQDAHGLTWVYGGAATFAVAALLPRRALTGGAKAGA